MIYPLDARLRGLARTEPGQCIETWKPQVRSALREMLPPVRESTLYFADRLIDAKSLDLDAEDVAAMLAVSYLHGFEDTMGPRQNWPPAAEELAR